MGIGKGGNGVGIDQRSPIESQVAYGEVTFLLTIPELSVCYPNITCSATASCRLAMNKIGPEVPYVCTSTIL